MPKTAGDVLFRFTVDFDFRPLPGQTVAYLAGMELPVPEAVALAAEAAGAGDRVSDHGAGQE